MDCPTGREKETDICLGATYLEHLAWCLSSLQTDANQACVADKD